MRSILRAPALALCFTLASTPAAGLTFLEVDVVCPIDGEEFRSVEMGSGTASCVRLDLRPMGAIAAPAPIHECPSTKFTFAREDFKPYEISALRPWVESAAYAETTALESRYYRLARAYIRIRRPERQIAWVLLKASWEVEREPERNRRYLAESLEFLEKHVLEAGLAGRLPRNRREERDLMLLAELRRRLRRFEAAASVLEQLERTPGIDEDDRRVIAFQADLVAKGDSAPHPAPVEGVEPGRCAGPSDARARSRTRELSAAERAEVDENLRRWCARNAGVVFGPENPVQRQMQSRCP